jgi:3-oxoacyl-[acyl-carrier protein] reductase
MKDNQILAGQVALVTGASRGIGLATALKLGQMGSRISICGRDRAVLGRAAESLRAHGIEVTAIPADVRQSADVEGLIAQTQCEVGPIDILVNNAGVGMFGQFHLQTETDWDSVIDTNLKSIFLACRAVAPEMMNRRTGHIINISSLAGKNTFASGAIYCASKWGVLGFSGCIAEELRAYGIRVSTICPGSVATEFSPHTGKDQAKMLQAEDVAHAVAALVTQAPGSFISEVLMRPTQKP